MCELLRNPNELRRAQSELASVVGLDRKVEDGDLEKLPYLRCVSKEVLRLHPSIPLLLRESLQDCTIAGRFVPRLDKRLGHGPRRETLAGRRSVQAVAVLRRCSLRRQGGWRLRVLAVRVRAAVVPRDAAGFVRAGARDGAVAALL
jgi:hypothetical protein